jgi:predicted acetyltransferase/predicted kinase
MKTLISFGGQLAALKTTVSKRISADLGVPVFNKDDIKEVLGDHIGFSNREENLKLSDATMSLMLYMAKSTLSVHTCVILESNFKKHEILKIEKLVKENGWNTLFIFMTANEKTLYQRYKDRNPNRHIVHKSTGDIPEDVFGRVIREYHQEVKPLSDVVFDTTAFNDELYHGLKDKINLWIKKHQSLELIKPNPLYLDSYKEAIHEHQDEVLTYQFSNPDQMDIFKKFENYRLGIDLPPLYVKQTYLWLVDGKDFIGEIGIRHALTESLTTFGGHIGYGIRYSKRNQGYGTVMLKLALLEAKKLGIDKALITCNDTNVGSYRVIEKNGGILWDKILLSIDGRTRLTRRYWINLKEDSYESHQTSST